MTDILVIICSFCTLTLSFLAFSENPSIVVFAVLPFFLAMIGPVALARLVSRFLSQPSTVRVHSLRFESCARVINDSKRAQGLGEGLRPIYIRQQNFRLNAVPVSCQIVSFWF